MGDRMDPAHYLALCGELNPLIDREILSNMSKGDFARGEVAEALKQQAWDRLIRLLDEHCRMEHRSFMLRRTAKYAMQQAPGAKLREAVLCNLPSVFAGASTPEPNYVEAAWFADDLPDPQPWEVRSLFYFGKPQDDRSLHVWDSLVMRQLAPDIAEVEDMQRRLKHEVQQIHPRAAPNLVKMHSIALQREMSRMLGDRPRAEVPIVGGGL